MPVLTIQLEGDGILKGFDGEVIHVTAPITLTSLKGGMQSGKPSVALIIDLPDGRKVIAETSAALLVTAAIALKAKYPELGL